MKLVKISMKAIFIISRNCDKANYFGTCSRLVLIDVRVERERGAERDRVVFCAWKEVEGRRTE